MKKFTSIHDVTFDDVLLILEQWQTGIISREDAFIFGEELFYLGERGFPDYPETNKRSVLFSAINLLDMVYTNPVIEEDIPTLIQFLKLGAENPLEAHKFMDQYWDSIDFDKRLREQYSK